MRRIAALMIIVCAAFPLFAHAQVQPQEDLHAAIMSELLRDPRTANIPPAQLFALVNALAQKAQEQNIAASDIRWHAQTFSGMNADQAVPIDFGDCAGGFSSLCTFTSAFGFVGNDPTIPLYLLVTSGLLILLIVRMIRHHRTVPVPAASSESNV